MPKEIWHLCRSLLESSSLYSQHSAIIEAEITTHHSKALRIRVQRFKFSELNYSCLLVILEDRSQTLQSLAISEIEQYGLTPREAEVWLLSRANYTRQEIAAELCISLNTVKKHLKNIQAKRSYRNIIQE
ncbi:MAG TPA: helix-turn-helix transcriptional regulator [Waterburya sp.]